MTLRGPWKANGGDHTSKLQVHHEQSRGSGLDTSVKLKLDSDTYDVEHSQKRTSNGPEGSTSLTMSKYPEYSYLLTYRMGYEDFPYAVSLELRVGGRPMLNVDVEVESPRRDLYRCSTRLVLHLEDSVESLAVKARHEKNRRNQWVTKGDLEYEVGKTVTFENVLDFENEKKLFKLKVDTPYDEVRSINLEYSHAGNVEENFNAKCSLSVDPHFDTVSSEVSWSNREQFRSRVRVDTPFEEMRYVEVTSQSSKRRGNKRHSTLTLDYSPRQVYKLDTVYRFDFPSDVDVAFNVTTPWKELPSLHTRVGFRYTDDEVKGDFTLVGPATNFKEFSSSFGHRRGPGSLSTQLDAVLAPGKTWSGRADLNWENEIDGTVKIESSPQGGQPMQLTLSHKGHTWQDFRTKAGFRQNGDRLESEVAYSNKNGGRSGLFMLATPDPDIDFFKTTFFQSLTEDTFEGRYFAQYGEASKPYELGLTTEYSDDKIAFTSDLKTPHSEDLDIEIGFAGRRRYEVKLFGMYGSDNKIDTLVKYTVRPEFWDVGSEFEYLVQGSGRNIGLTFKRDGPLEDLRCHSTAKYMGKEVSVATQYRHSDKATSGRLDVRTNFKDYTDLAASFNHSGDSTHFDTDVYLKYQDDREAKGTVDFQRNRWRRVVMTSTFKLPFAEYHNNKLTYKHTYRKNKLAADVVLKLGLANAINGEVEFVDGSKLTLSITGPFKDFESFSASGIFDQADKRLEATSALKLLSQPEPLTGSYMVRAGIWPVMVNVQARTPFDGWKSVELTSTHDGGIADFTTSHTLKAEAVGTVTSETIWTYASPFVYDGRWTFTSSIPGAEDLRLSVKSTQTGRKYSTRLIAGWELLKEITLDTSAQIGGDYSSDSYSASNRYTYTGSVALTTPFPEASQLSVAFDHSSGPRRIQDSAVVRFNDKTYLDADFAYRADERRVGTLEFREPRPMEFLVGGRYTPSSLEGELKLNWDKRLADMNLHLTGEYADRTDQLGTDKSTKVSFWTSPKYI